MRRASHSVCTESNWGLVSCLRILWNVHGRRHLGIKLPTLPLIPDLLYLQSTRGVKSYPLLWIWLIFRRLTRWKLFATLREKLWLRGSPLSPSNVSCLPLLLIMAKIDKHKSKSILLRVVKSVCEPLLSHYSFYGSQIYLETHFSPTIGEESSCFFLKVFLVCCYLVLLCSRKHPPTDPKLHN